MKARVDPDICAACGPCTEICPQVFEIGDDNVAHVKLDPIPPELEDKVREAKDACPPGAIIIEE